MLLKRLYFNNFKDPLTNFYWTVVTLYERTISEAVNLHDRCPKMCLGEVYMIAIPEYDDKAFARREIAFKAVNPDITEKYIKSFQAINNRISTDKNAYQYEHVCLLIVDFNRDTPKIYNTTAELKADGLLAQDSIQSIEDLTFSEFSRKMLATYRDRFGEGKFI